MSAYPLRLIRKRKEAKGMKKQKRLISILLAVIIIVSSFGAGFSAFAAKDPYQTLIDALNVDTVKQTSWGSPSVSGKDYLTVVNDPTGDIEKAVKAFWAVAEIEMPNGHTGALGNDLVRTARGIVNSILDTLQKEPYNVSGEDLIYVTNVLVAFVGGMAHTNQSSSLLDYPTAPGERNYGIKIQKDLKSVLLASDKDVEKLGESVTVSTSYIFEHGVGQWKSSGFLGSYYSYNYLKEDGMKIVEEKGGKDEIAALKAFGKYFTDDLLKTNLSKLSSDELDELAKNNQAAVDALGALWGQEDIINHFFSSKDKIEEFILSVSSERDLKVAEDIANEFKELIKKDPVGMDLESLTGLLTQATELKTKFENCSVDARHAALENAGITAEDISSFVSKVNEEKEVIELQGFKKTVDETIDGFVIEGAEKQAVLDALKVVKEQLSMITTRTAPAIARVFPEGTQYIVDFITKAELEIDFINLNEAALVDYFVYFNADLLNMDLKSVSTDDLIDNYLKTGKEKLDAIKKYDKVTIDRVFGEKYDDILNYIESIYVVLTERITDEGNEIFGNYNKYSKITLLNHNEIEDAIGKLETKIYPVVEDRLSQEFKDEYAKISKMAEELAHYNETFGVEGYVKSEMIYPVRESFANDIVRTPDEAYKVTNESLNEVVARLDSVMSDDKISLLTGIDGTLSEFIKKTIKEQAYTDATVNELVNLLYSTVVGIIEPLSLDLVVVSITGRDLINELYNFGVALYPNQLANKVDGEKYPEVKAALSAAGTDWSAYNKAVSWNVTDKESFVEAVGHALKGLEPLLRTALGNTNLTGSILGLVNLTVEHMDIYDKAILPMLEGLEMKGLKSTEEFNKLTTTEEMMSVILLPVLNWAEDLADAPVATLIDVLPKIAYVFDHDMVTAILKDTTVKVTASALFIKLDVLDLIGVKDKSIIGLLNYFAPDVDISFLGDINALVKMVLDMAAPDASIVLPTINQSMLASHGQMITGVDSLTSKGVRYQIITDRGDTLLAVLRYVLPLLADSDIISAVLNLVGADVKLDENIEKIISNIGLNADNTISAIVELFVPKTYNKAEYNFINQDNPDELINTVKYSYDWSQKKADYLDRNLAEYVDNIIKVLGGSEAKSLSHIIKSFITNDIYTNATVTSLVLMVKNELAKLDIDLNPIMAAVGIDLSIWDEVEEGYNWGFTDGDKDGFAMALSKALSPFGPYLATIFAGEDTTVLSAVTIKGYDGYTNGIVPLLEAIGCDSDDLLTLEEYKAAVKNDNSKAIELILTPVLNLLDRIYRNPVDELMDMLPNLIYFVNSGALNVAIKNSAQSLLAILDTVRPIIDLQLDLDFDVSKIIVDLIAGIEVDGKPLNIKIPFLSDPTSLLVGRVKAYESKSGETLYKLQNSIDADFVTVLMRSVIEIAFYQDNINAVADLVAEKVGIPPKQTNQLKQILDLLSSLYKQINGVDKTLNAIYVLFKGTDVALDTSVSAVSGFNERWSAVFEKFYESGNEDLIALAEKADATLKFLTLGFVSSEGVGTAGLVSFGQKLVSFLQGKVGSVKINKTSLELFEGENASLKVTIYPIHARNKNIIWASDNEEVATVENGTVKALRAGSAMITATTVDGNLTVSAKVTVKADKKFLQETIVSMSEVILNGAEPEKAEAFKEAYNNACEIRVDVNATQQQVDDAAKALLDAFKNLDENYKGVESVEITLNGEAADTFTVNVGLFAYYPNSSVKLSVNVIPEGAVYKEIEWSAKGAVKVDSDGLVSAKLLGFGNRSGDVTVKVHDFDGNVYEDTVKVTFKKF